MVSDKRVIKVFTASFLLTKKSNAHRQRDPVRHLMKHPGAPDFEPNGAAFYLKPSDNGIAGRAAKEKVTARTDPSLVPFAI
jgi:hypothetical protein